MQPVDPVVRSLQIRRFREMSAEAKLRLSDELLELARELKRSSLLKTYPRLSPEELEARVTELFAHVAR